MQTVKCLGDSWGVSVYNAKNKTANPARAEMFTKKYANENKIIDLSFLPPCESTLLLHLKRVIRWLSYGKHVYIVILHYSISKTMVG